MSPKEFRKLSRSKQCARVATLTPERRRALWEARSSMTASKIVLVFSIAYAIYIIGWRL